MDYGLISPATDDTSAEARWARLERLLDDALEDSFPASDPISLSRADHLG